MTPERRATLSVACAAVLFGSTFLLTKNGVEDASPSAFLAARFLGGSIAILGVAVARGRRHYPSRGIAGPAVACGVVLSAGYALQTIGLQYTASSTSAFITYLLVIFVALLAAILHRAVPAPTVLAGLVVATAGMWLLTGGTGGAGDAAGFGRGEVLTLGCALAYAVHILLLDRYSRRFDTAWFTGLQLLVVGLLCLGPGFAQGGYSFSASTWFAAGATGLGASAIALTLQIGGQRRLGPTRTAVLLMLEPVTAAVLGYLVGERLGLAGGVGASLILVGIGLAEARPSPGGPTSDPGMRETPVNTGHSGVSSTSDL
ncbi:MAG TPA: DMT family transporter [Acidimicrobiales bacterium]|nr:DMT family transporter [Acidimicrobiales bacterium]